jgi:hypothetical protein
MGNQTQRFYLIHLFTLMMSLVKDLEEVSDEQLLEDLRAIGKDPEREATLVRDVIMAAIEEADKEELQSAGPGSRVGVQTPLFLLPETPELRRSLLEELMASYHDSTDLSDDAVETLLHTFIFVGSMNSLAARPDGPEGRPPTRPEGLEERPH